jgi:hypothetical protein
MAGSHPTDIDKKYSQIEEGFDEELTVLALVMMEMKYNFLRLSKIVSDCQSR